MKKPYSKLRGRIVEEFESQRAFADKIGLSVQTVSAKLSGKSEFSRGDIVSWSEALGIPPEDVGSYFFGKELMNGASSEK